MMRRHGKSKSKACIKSALRNGVVAIVAAGISGFAFSEGDEAISRAGLDPAKYEAGEITIVSVRAPWSESSRVAFAGVDVYNTDGNLARLGVGRDETLPVPRAQLLWAADPNVDYVIDCLVTGDAQAFIASRFDGERERENRRDATIARNGDRISVLVGKGTAGNIYLHSVDAPWAFKECAIIAIADR
ncbi:MAG: hypothetical protein SV422_12155 [Pseudomonadota bacterium]|nr:hypothetical protein [Pseudomonadota bacterium]